MKPLDACPNPEVQRDIVHPGVIVLDEIQRSEELPATVSPEQAFSAVMCSLEQALSRAGVEQLQRRLPTSIRKVIACTAHGDDADPAQLTNAAGFLRRVSEHLELDSTQSRELARAVFHALHRLMSVGEVDDVARELPEDLRPLWRAGDDGTDPIRSSRLD
jgi:uncharacterized protein (DUF2267 family)